MHAVECVFMYVMLCIRVADIVSKKRTRIYKFQQLFLYCSSVVSDLCSRNVQPYQTTTQFEVSVPIAVQYSYIICN
jgi:hypothetical protein